MAGLRRICRHLIWIAFQTSFKCGLGLIRNYYSHLALPCLSMLIIYVVTDRKLWLVVQRQSPQVQYQQAMVLVLNNVQKSGFVEHYDTTVKFTFDLLDLESSLHHCNLEICVKLCHKELWSPLTTKFSSVHPWVQMDIYDKSEEITSGIPDITFTRRYGWTDGQPIMPQTMGVCQRKCIKIAFHVVFFAVQTF